MPDLMPPLPVLPDAEFTRVLCVVAHPDDLEYGTSAAVAEWTDRGVEVSYLLLTAGEAGMPTPPEETRRLRAQEQRAACACVGVDSLRILDHPDGMLVYGLDLRRDIARVVREVRPDAVVTGVWDVEAYGGLNQADHRAAGLATLDAVRDADNAWVFSELAEEGRTAWSTRWLLVAGHPRATHGIPVSDRSVERAVASLAAHRAYLEALPGHPSPADFIPQITAQGGAALDVPHAVLFRGFDLHSFGGED